MTGKKADICFFLSRSKLSTLRTASELKRKVECPLFLFHPSPMTPPTIHEKFDNPAEEVENSSSATDCRTVGISQR